MRSAITALYRRVSPDGVRAYATSLAPVDAAFSDVDDLHLGAQRVAGALVHHLRLPQAVSSWASGGWNTPRASN